MKKHQFLIVDEDVSFVDSVTAFLPVSVYASKVGVRAFTSAAAAERALDKAEDEPLIVFSESIADSAASFQQLHKKVLLVGYDPGPPAIPETDSRPQVKLFKYQSLNKLFEQLCKFDEAFRLSEHPKADISSGNAQITAVYSAMGGAGKTTVALYIAQALLAGKQRTLYMSLESLNAVDPILHTGKTPQADGRFSQLIYYLLTEPGKLQSRWESYIDVDRSTGLHYIAPEQAVREMEAMNGDTVKKLIDALAKSNRYDRIVLDLDSSLHARTVGALKRSDQIVWLVLADQASLYKTETARVQLPDLRNIHWVVNRHTGQWMPGHIELGIDPTAYLPYIPEWKHVAESVNVLAHRLFSESIGQLINHIYSPDSLERLRAV